jgi:hypothetical protein
MIRTALVGLVGVASLTVGIGGGQQATPPRDQRTSIPTGTAVLAGVVTAADPGAPAIRTAQVAILGTENGLIRIASSDDDGRFVIAGLPAGRYLLSAKRSPFVDAVYGTTQPGRPGTAIALREGEQRTDIVLKMIRGAVISGTVTDEQGQPAVDVNVELSQPRQGTGDQQMLRDMMRMPPTRTDDRGTFRFPGLAAGEYILAVMPADLGASSARVLEPGEVKAAIDSLLEPPAPRVTPLGETRLPNSTVILPPRGGGAGNFEPMGLGPLPVRGGGPGGPGPIAMQTVGYASIYFPGTTDIAEAVPIAVAAGEERRGVDLVSRPVPTTRVEGVVIAADGQPVTGAIVSARVSGRESISLMRMSGMSSGMGRSGAEGRFVLSGLPPGKYSLEARSGAPSDVMMFGRAGGPGPRPQGPQQWASTEFVANGLPLSGLVLRLQPGLSLSGRIAFDAAAATPPKDFAGVFVSMRPVNTGILTAMTGGGSASASRDGTFTVTGVMPGRYLLTAAVANGDNPADSLVWLGHTVTIGGRDMTDLAVEVRPDEELKGLVITLTDRQQELSGRLQDATGRPAPDFTVLLFPADRKYWLPASRRILTTRPATDGQFSFRGPLGPPPGDYLLAAVTDHRPDDEFNPAFLDAVAKAALKITLKPGEHGVQNLQIVGK